MASIRYVIHQSNSRGGKAGRGNNRTATIQVLEPCAPGHGYLLRKAFAYCTDDAASKAEAIAKAKAYVEALA